ncbi:DNA polymerase IV [Bifidobacterium adolescentis]|uniref:DNA polymerase IV n=1 Tax=Bifidobacterium adolescentis TaxID=1680 RepID=A0A7J5N0T1_BIFAD|nr:DNA polymerase IV [Bifidobacterium adolescentis]KAB5748323.1 DNA polymerase IV [Bifidobacterium adolescentis]KAB5749571.1 DNA polymerase IV [Bifidobacterium adolescentis]
MRHAGMPAGFAIFEHLFQNCRIVVYHGIMSTAPRIAAAKRDWGHDEVGCTVLHIDMDAFFASLEVARHPEYADKPVIIGIGNRSVVSAANYEARKYGINSAMASSRARKLCPNGVFLPVDIHYYREMSRRIFTEVFSRVTDRIEQVSVDECYMDVSGALLRWKSPRAIGAWIRDQVARRYHITCSVGIAANKLVAKMASTNAKPDGMLMIPVARHAEFVQMMPLRGIPGIGPSLEKRLNAWGVDSVADLAKMSMESLEQATGSAISARGLYMAARGLDDRPVAPRAQEKSVGAERTFDKDTQDMRQVTSMLRWCCDDVAGTLRRRGLMARKVMVKLRFPDLSYATKGHTLDCPTDAASMLYPQCVALLLAMMGMPESSIDAISLTRPVRLAGMSAGGLVEAADAAVQLSLDDMLEEQNEAQRGRGTDTEPSTQSERLRGAETALDAVRLKYGKGSVRLGIWRTGPSGNLEH